MRGNNPVPGQVGDGALDPGLVLGRVHLVAEHAPALVAPQRAQVARAVRDGPPVPAGGRLPAEPVPARQDQALEHLRAHMH